jgi:hypothetical protein
METCYVNTKTFPGPLFAVNSIGNLTANPDCSNTSDHTIWEDFEIHHSSVWENCEASTRIPNLSEADILYSYILLWDLQPPFQRHAKL